MTLTSKTSLIAGLVATFASFASAQPNVVLILVDDMGYSDLGCFGSEIDTPNIDRLASNGIAFTNFTNDSKCGPSRTALMSGRYDTEVKADGPKSVITIPELLATKDYQNFMIGKWHIFDSPLERGFDRMFGIMSGWCNSLNGEWQGEPAHLLDGQQYLPPEDFYTTNAYSEFAQEFIRERDRERPFFLYLAFNAPHYPLHAPKPDIMKYRGRYMKGWSALRESRLKKMKQLGIVPENQILSPSDAEDWDSLSQEERERQDLIMATYAAMVDGVDRGVGRLIETLKSEGVFDDTLILFLSDNGACPFDRTEEETLAKGYMPWDERSYYTYDENWANACNTPWSKFKQNQNEGGISTPLIAHWPKGIKEPGRFDRQRGHLVDLHATFRELTGIDYPKTYKGNTLGPARGLSLAAAFAGEPRPIHDELFYRYGKKYSALTRGTWKVVDQSHLYDLSSDRTEANDLKAKHPDVFTELSNRWEELYGEFSKDEK